MQFRFRSGKGAIDAIFTVRQMQVKPGNKGKQLEKVFGRVPREVGF